MIYAIDQNKIPKKIVVFKSQADFDEHCDKMYNESQIPCSGVAYPNYLTTISHLDGAMDLLTLLFASGCIKGVENIEEFVPALKDYND